MPEESRVTRITERLRELRSALSDVEASAVVSPDGLIVASDLPAEVEEDRVSAMSAAMLSLGAHIARELGRGELEEVYIRGAQGYVLLMAAGEDAVLTVLARSEARPDVILPGARRTATDIAALV